MRQQRGARLVSAASSAPDPYVDASDGLAVSICWSAAAHDPGLQVMRPEDYVPPLGMGPHPVQQDIALKPGDRLLFYTDGLVEARDRAGRFLDLGDHVAAALAAPDLNAAIRSVVRLLLDHAGDGLADDVLLVLSEPLTP